MGCRVLPSLRCQSSLSAFPWPPLTKPSMTFFSVADFYSPQVCSQVADRPGRDLINQAGREGRIRMLPSSLHTVDPRYYCSLCDISQTG